MRRICLSLLLVAPLLAPPALLSQNQSGSEHRGKALALGVDYADQVHHGGHFGYIYNEPKIRDLVRTAKRAGIDEIHWRVSAVGVVTYRSKVMTVMDGSRLSNPNFASIGVILKQCDPLAVAIDEAHRLSMKLFVYITLFDFAYPGMESDFFRKHPEYYSRLAGVRADQAKTGLPGAKEAEEFYKTVRTGGYPAKLSIREQDGTAPYVRGVPDFGYPEVREHLLAQVRELIAYKPDGIYFDVSRTHAGVYPVVLLPGYPQWTSPYLSYGYNEPEIARYKERYGKNPPLRWHDNLRDIEVTKDEENWNAVRGSFLTDFLRQASNLVHASGMKVIVAFYPTTYNFYQPGTQTRPPLGHIQIEWRTWCDEKLIDIIRLEVDHRKHGYDDWVDNSAKTYKYAQDRGIKVYLDCAIEHAFDVLKTPPVPLPIREATQPDLYYKIISDTTRNILNSSADGVVYYEAGHNTEGLYEAIRRGAGR